MNTVPGAHRGVVFGPACYPPRLLGQIQKSLRVVR
jgi:hypothetical protein